MCCHLVRLKYQCYHHQPQLERDRQRGGNGGICDGKPTGTVSHVISHQVPLHRVSLFTKMRPRLLVSQRASSVSLYHANTCEALCQPPSATNQPTHYYKPHTLAHHCYTEWAAD